MNTLGIIGFALCLTASAVGQNFLIAGPGDPIVFAGTVDDPISFFHVRSSSPQPIIDISGHPPSGGVATVKFAYSGVARVNFAVPMPPNYVVVSPPSGTTPAILQVGLNEAVVRTMAPGNYILEVVFTTTDQDPPRTAGVGVAVQIANSAPPNIVSVLDTASYLPTISPGQIVSIFGTHLAPALLSLSYDATGKYPTTVFEPTGSVLGGTTITFDGIPAPLLYVSPAQVNAVAPYGIAGKKSVDVVVSRYGSKSSAFSIAIADAAPALFTATQTGTGQGAILQLDSNYNVTLNSAANPISAGGIIELFGTGQGAWSPAVQDGAISLTATRFTTLPVSLSIAGKPAEILYTGSSPYQVWGLLQVNAVLPQGLPSGAQAVVLKIGGADNSRQNVTIAVK